MIQNALVNIQQQEISTLTSLSKLETKQYTSSTNKEFENFHINMSKTPERKLTYSGLN